MIENFWIQVLLLAVVLDVFFGEPPAFAHPVVWMGGLIQFFVDHAPARHRKLYGLFLAVFCAGAAGIAGLLVLSQGPGVPGLLLAAYFLKSTFSIRMLLNSASGIRKSLLGGRIENVRRDLKTFVGRDTSSLNEHQSASAVIESLAESFVDGILSPLFYFLLFGLPGALVYRMINTLDSMVGYRKEPFTELGYVSAVLDDIANWLPSRLSPVFIFTASVFFGRPADAVRTCITDHNKTASPNSGWVMSAVSGALRVRLEKIDYHILGENYPVPDPGMIKKAVHIVGFSSFLLISGIYVIGDVPFFRL